MLPSTLAAQANNLLTPLPSNPIIKNVKNDAVSYQRLQEQGDIYYKRKRFNEAAEQYLQSLKYLTSDDTTTQHQLALTYTNIAQCYKRLKDRQKVNDYYEKSLSVFNFLDNKRYIARTLNSLAEAQRHLGNLTSALNYSMKSLAVHKTIEDPQGNAKALMGAGINYRYLARYEDSINHVHQSYLYHKAVKNYNSIAKTSNEMGNIYIELEQFNQAEYFFKETIKLTNKHIEPNTMATALREMAVINLAHKDYQSAMSFAQRAYNIYEVENDTLKKSRTARIIANIYHSKQDIPNAIKSYRNSISLAQAVNNQLSQVESQILLADMLITQDASQAINLLVSALKITKHINNEKQTLLAYKALRRAKELQGDFQQALHFAKQEIKLSKVIQKKSIKQKLTLAKATLNSHKMEIELEALRERVTLDQLELIKKNNEIEIAKQSKKINELELIKNQYTSFALACLLIICVCFAIWFFRRFIASKKRNRELKYLASRDPLTHCYNRRSLFELMGKYFASDELDTHYCVIMADIDYFKNVNDTYGHDVGDIVISSIAATLQSCIRQNDIVARYGGEEFCIVLHKTSVRRAMEIAEKMRHKIENTQFDNVAITSSFGVSSLQLGAKTPTALIKQADIALYQSKSLGRNQVTLWDESLN